MTANDNRFSYLCLSSVLVCSLSFLALSKLRYDSTTHISPVELRATNSSSATILQLLLPVSEALCSLSNVLPVLHHVARNSAQISTGHSSVSISWPRRISVLSHETVGYLLQRWLRMLRDECGWHDRAIQQILVVSPVWTQRHLIGIVISHDSKDLPAIEFSSWRHSLLAPRARIVVAFLPNIL